MSLDTERQQGGFSPGDQLGGMVSNILHRLGSDPPEAMEKVRPPHLRVSIGVPRGINSQALSVKGGSALILMGGGLYSLCEHYARAAATYFLPAPPSKATPSEHWPGARASLASTVDWLSSPTPDVRYHAFDSAPRHTNAALPFAVYAYRFAVCHELAHVILGHLRHDDTHADETARNRWTQQQEFAADRLGLRLQILSLPDSSDVVTALAAAVYLIHLTGLLDLRLMLLARLVDHDEWKIAYTHPPRLARFAYLMPIADEFYPGGAAGLMRVHNSLTALDNEIMQTANEQQEAVAQRAEQLLNDEAATGDGTLRFAQEMDELLDRSPTGVLRALEPSVSRDTDRLEAARESYAARLPTEFQRFRDQSFVERARDFATHD